MDAKKYDAEREDKYGLAAMSWHGWGSPVGLSIALVAVGVFLWFLHLAGLIN